MQRPNIVTVEACNEAGATTWWSLSGEVDEAKLHAAWSARTLDPKLLPKATSPHAALRSACMVEGKRRRLVRPLGGGQTGYAIVDEQPSVEKTDPLRHRLLATVTLNAIGRPVFSDPEEVVPATADDRTRLIESARQIPARVTAAYEHALDVLDHDVIGGWLPTLVYAANAVRLRESGGIYFVPRAGLDFWRLAAAALSEVSSNVVYEIPALHTASAVAAVLDALTAEATARTSAAFETIAGGERGARGLRSIETDATALLAKLAGYEELLGDKLTAIRARAEEARAAAAAAVLVAEAARGAK